ncbi:MAG: hypothetical protein IT445_00875 [Phycisphaeraceae bacterium]|nr:hypothetical protein [Phycisphaeraceae bacterium]
MEIKTMSGNQWTKVGYRALVILASIASTSQGSIQVFHATSPSNNSASRSSWLTAIGQSPMYLIDFETGFSDGQDIHNQTLAGGMIVSGASNAVATVTSSTSSLGGSSPLDTLALRFDDDAELDFFANPLDYIAFYDINALAPAFTIHFVGGNSITYNGTANQTIPRFTGFYRNDQPQIERVTLVGGRSVADPNWGIDNIEFGTIAVPEPALSWLLALGGTLITWQRKRIRSEGRIGR